MHITNFKPMQKGMDNFLNKFDMVCGTSAGGIIALGILAGKKLEDAKSIFKAVGE